MYYAYITKGRRTKCNKSKDNAPNYPFLHYLPMSSIYLSIDRISKPLGADLAAKISCWCTLVASAPAAMSEMKCSDGA